MTDTRYVLAHGPQSASEARELVEAWAQRNVVLELTRRHTRLHQLMEFCETAVLLVNELVTNSVRHTSSATITLVLRPESAGLMALVEDEDPGYPRPGESGDGELSGFGLLVVDRLADEWGWDVDVTNHRKQVWFRLEYPHAAATAGAAVRAATSGLSG